MVAAMATTQLVRTSTLDPLLHARRHESQTELENFLSETEMKKWQLNHEEVLKNRAEKAEKKLTKKQGNGQQKEEPVSTDQSTDERVDLGSKSIESLTEEE